MDSTRDTDSDDWIVELIVEAVASVVSERGSDSLSDEELDKMMKRDVVDQQTPKLVDGICEHLEKDAWSQMRERRAIGAEFGARLMHRWGEGFDRFRLLYVASIEIGEMFANRWHGEMNRRTPI